MQRHDASPSFDVLVVGCGLMGSALARTLARGGQRVAAWNRTPSKAAALSEAGASPVEDLAGAVAATSMVLACTSSYSDLYDVLDPIDTWGDQLFVNLTTGTPQEADDFASWMADRAVETLDGTIFVYPRSIGTEQAYIAYAGPPSAWARGGEVLGLLGRARFMPGAHRLNADLALGMIAYYISGITCFVEAMAYLQAREIPAEVAAEATDYLSSVLKETVTEVGAAIEADVHRSDQARLVTFAEGVADAVSAFQVEGIRSRLLEGSLDTLRAACEAGLGDLGISAQVKVVAAKGSGGS